MKLKTFYRIYYRHRFEKSNFLRKIYLTIILPLSYLVNLIFIQKKNDLDKFVKNNEILYEKDLNYLFEYFNSDKGEKYSNQYIKPIKKNDNLIQAHGYSKIYEKYFYKIKNKNLNIMEIGSFYGNASAALYFYFKNSRIFSADINPDMYRYKAKRLDNFYVNSSERTSIEKQIVNKKIKFDVIIEDASHMLKDQIISLFILFPSLKKNGLFIIEEVDFPEKREDMRIGHKKPDLKTILNNVILKKDFNSEYILESEKKYFLLNCAEIKFFKGNFNEIAIIRKKWFILLNV